METEFERVVAAMGLAEEQWAGSPKVRAWVRRHYRSRYIPEELLLELELRPTDGLAKVKRGKVQNEDQPPIDPAEGISG